MNAKKNMTFKFKTHITFYIILKLLIYFFLFGWFCLLKWDLTMYP